MNNNLLTFLTTSPLLQNFCISWLPPRFLGEVLSGLLQMLPPGLQVLNFPAK